MCLPLFFLLPSIFLFSFLIPYVFEDYAASLKRGSLSETLKQTAAWFAR
jgi:hypothetical protein